MITSYSSKPVPGPQATKLVREQPSQLPLPFFLLLINGCAQMDNNSKRRDYRGKVRTMAQALSDTPHGGQIIIDSQTFDGVKTSLPELLAAVPASPDYRELQDQAK